MTTPPIMASISPRAAFMILSPFVRDERQEASPQTIERRACESETSDDTMCAAIEARASHLSGQHLKVRQWLRGRKHSDFRSWQNRTACSVLHAAHTYRTTRSGPLVAMAKTAAPRVSVTWSKPGRSLARAEDAAIRCVQPGTRHLKLLAVAVTGWHRPPPPLRRSTTGTFGLARRCRLGPF